MCTKYTPINISGRRERKANAEKIVFLADCATLVFAHSKYVAMDFLCASRKSSKKHAALSSFLSRLSCTCLRLKHHLRLFSLFHGISWYNNAVDNGNNDARATIKANSPEEATLLFSLFLARWISLLFFSPFSASDRWPLERSGRMTENFRQVWSIYRDS